MSSMMMNIVVEDQETVVVQIDPTLLQCGSSFLEINLRTTNVA